jgi:hypothetical protein
VRKEGFIANRWRPRTDVLGCSLSSLAGLVVICNLARIPCCALHPGLLSVAPAGLGLSGIFTLGGRRNRESEGKSRGISHLAKHPGFPRRRFTDAHPSLLCRTGIAKYGFWLVEAVRILLGGKSVPQVPRLRFAALGMTKGDRGCNVEVCEWASTRRGVSFE